MKKALSFAVALGLVAGVATVASAAELTINGDARWRGVYKQNTVDSTDHLDDAAADGALVKGATESDAAFLNRRWAEQGQDTTQRMDQRYRFNANLKINDDVTINTRIVLRDSIFGNNYPAGQGFTTDRANMVINTLGGTWTIGRQDVSWGNKFLAWGESADRFKGIYKTGNITYGGFLQKDVEGDYNNGDGDKDSYAGVFIMKAGDTTFGVLPVYTISDANSTATIEKGDDGWLIDPYFTAKMGPATVMGEFVFQGGDLNENSDGDMIWGGFVGASVDLAPVTVKGLVAYWDGNDKAIAKRDCDNDFAPSVLIGTCNETAVINFGATVSGPNDSTYLVGAGVDFKASDKLTLGGLVGYLMASENGGENEDQDATLVEIDLTAKYALAQNVNYTLSAAYAMPDQFSEQDDDWMVVGNRIEVAW